MTMLTAAQIRTRLENHEYGYDEDEDGDDWAWELAELLRKHGIDPVTAWTHAQENHDSDATFDASDIGAAFTDSYSGLWDSAREFARDRWAMDLQEFGDPGERKGREDFMKDFSPYIDWQAVADSPLLSDYTMIRFNEDDTDRRVYVFEIG